MMYMVVITSRHKESFSQVFYFTNLVVQERQHVTGLFESAYFIQHLSIKPLGVSAKLVIKIPFRNTEC